MAFGIFFVEDDHKAQRRPRCTWADHVKRGIQAARDQQGISVQWLHPQQKGPVHHYMFNSKLSHMKSYSLYWNFFNSTYYLIIFNKIHCLSVYKIIDNVSIIKIYKKSNLLKTKLRCISPFTFIWKILKSWLIFL